VTHIPLNHLEVVLMVICQGLKCIEQLGKIYRVFGPQKPKNSATDATQFLADKQPKASLDGGEFTK